MNFTTHSRVAIAMLVGVFLLLPGNVHALSVTHYLNLGAQDAMTAGEVSVLQQFLAGDSSIYPQKLVTGRFGSATEAALQRLQKYWAAQDVSLKLPSSGSARTSGFGATGPRTRALLALLKTPKERATAAVVALPAAPLKVATKPEPSPRLPAVSPPALAPIPAPVSIVTPTPPPTPIIVATPAPQARTEPATTTSSMTPTTPVIAPASTTSPLVAASLPKISIVLPIDVTLNRKASFLLGYTVSLDKNDSLEKYRAIYWWGDDVSSGYTDYVSGYFKLDRLANIPSQNGIYTLTVGLVLADYQLGSKAMPVTFDKAMVLITGNGTSQTYLQSITPDATSTAPKTP